MDKSTSNISGGESDEARQSSSINPGCQEMPMFSGELVDANSVRFIPDMDIDGIYLVKDSSLVKTLQKQLGVFNHRPKNPFPVNWPISLNKSHLKSLETDQFVVTLRPEGIRCLFFADSEGNQFMQNGTQEIFKLFQSRAFQLIPAGTVLDGIVVSSKNVRGETTQHSNTDVKPTFVIMDATRVNGNDLTQKNILDRIATVQSEIMQLRLNGVKKKRIATDREVFNLDIAHYNPPSSMDEYVTQSFKDDYPYPVRSFVFYRLNGTYAGGSKSILQWNENNEQDCSFRLKISSEEGQSTGELYAVGPKKIETKYKCTMDLTDECKTMNGSVIDCRYVENQWQFVRVRKDRKFPNSHHTISEKLKSLKNHVTCEMLLDSIKKGGQEPTNSSSLQSPNFVDLGFKKEADISGEFVGIDLKVTFLENGNVDGISRVQNLHLIRELQVRLAGFNQAQGNRFPVNLPILLNKTTINKIKKAGTVVVAPKPLGVRYLLYVDPEGNMYMENETQHIFIVDQDRAPRLIPKDTVLDGIVVKKVVRDGAAQNKDQAASGKLNFVIMDATRVNGVALTKKGIKERISVVQAEIIQKRLATTQAGEEEQLLDGPKMKRRRTEDEIFDLDITKYEPISDKLSYLTKEFKTSYEYPLQSFVFNPLVGAYSCGGDGKRIYQWNNEIIEVECAFLLKIIPGKRAELYTTGEHEQVVKYKSSLEWTEELNTMADCIIDCRYLDGHWSFVRVNTDRKKPNCIHWISGKVATLTRSVTFEELIASLVECQLKEEST